MISLTPRLEAVAKLVIPHKTIADVGTDHAYIPIYLINSEMISKAIATDIHRGPYKIAKAKAKAHGVEDKIDVRLGDGLMPVNAGEIQVAIVAGMGGLTIRDILLQSPEIVQELEQLVLQPMTAPEEVRKWLASNGWKLTAELLVREEDKYYQIISAVPGTQTWPTSKDSLIWQLGPLLVERGEKLLIEYIEKLIAVNRNLLVKLIKVDTPKGILRVRQLQLETKELEELRNTCLLNANK